MRKSRFAEAQIIGMIKEKEAGMLTAEVCRRHALPGKPKINPLSPRQLNRAFTSAKHMAGIKKAATLHTLRRNRFIGTACLILA